LLFVNVQVPWCRFHPKKAGEERKMRSLGRLSVVVGAHRVRNRDEASQTRHFIEKADVHERYVAEYPNHDIMLLRLNESIQFNRRVRPICVDTTEFEPDAPCYVTGWGRINPDPNST